MVQRPAFDRGDDNWPSLSYVSVMREEIIREIRRLAAANEGKSPGQIAFARDTGIGDHIWRGKIWARWGDALVDAGFEPNDWNRALDSAHVLDQVVAACRHYRRMPTKAEFQLYRNVDPTFPSYAVLGRHFGSRNEQIEALRKRVATRKDHADVAAFLPAPKPIMKRAVGLKSLEGFVYLIKSGDFYKIGRSDDIERRVKEIRIALPDKAMLVHTIRTDDPPGIEAYWHRRFADRRANGEWFKLTALDVSAFRKRRFQ